MASQADTSEVLTPAGRPDEIKAVPVRHVGRWIAAVIVLVVAASLVYSAANNPNFHWDLVRSYLFDSRILGGLRITLELTVLAMAIGIVLGVTLAIMRLSPNPVVSGVSWVYIWAFRGTPVLVQVLFWAFIASVWPTISLGVPFGGPSIISGSANSIITPFVAGMLGLGLNEGAYMAEIVRAGIISVDEGQSEAAHALGMTRLQTMRRIVLPQAMRVIVPPTGNETISMLKTSSIVAFIALGDLLYSVTLIYSQNFRQIPLLVVASFWYLVCTTILSIGQYYIERRFGRGSTRELPPTPMQRLRRNVFARHAQVELPAPGEDHR